MRNRINLVNFERQWHRLKPVIKESPEFKEKILEVMHNFCLETGRYEYWEWLNEMFSEDKESYPYPFYIDKDFMKDWKVPKHTASYDLRLFQPSARCFWIAPISKMFAEYLYPNRKWKIQCNPLRHALAVSVEERKNRKDYLIADLLSGDYKRTTAIYNYYWSHPSIDSSEWAEMSDLTFKDDNYHFASRVMHCPCTGKAIDSETLVNKELLKSIPFGS